MSSYNMDQLSMRYSQYTQVIRAKAPIRMPARYPEGLQPIYAREAIAVDYRSIEDRAGKIVVHPQTDYASLYYLWEVLQGKLDDPAVMLREFNTRLNLDDATPWPANPGPKYVQDHIRMYGAFYVSRRTGVTMRAVRYWREKPTSISWKHLDTLAACFGDRDMCAYALLPGSTIDLGPNPRTWMAAAIGYAMALVPYKEPSPWEPASSEDLEVFEQLTMDMPESFGLARLLP